MKIILQRPVDKLGVPGDVVDVADGYARNFLIPRGLAQPASKGAVRAAKNLRDAHDRRVGKALAEARATAERLQASPVRLPARAGEEGRIFGSITAADIVEGIEKSMKLTLDRRALHLDQPIRSIGSHEVTVHLHPEVNATVTVEVVAQK
jgi:large subunit ribosomal protein L9